MGVHVSNGVSGFAFFLPAAMVASRDQLLTLWSMILDVDTECHSRKLTNIQTRLIEVRGLVSHHLTRDGLISNACETVPGFAEKQTSKPKSPR
jgi:hypothetical protein